MPRRTETFFPNPLDSDVTSGSTLESCGHNHTKPRNLPSRLGLPCGLCITMTGWACSHEWPDGGWIPALWRPGFGAVGADSGAEVHRIFFEGDPTVAEGRLQGFARCVAPAARHDGGKTAPIGS